MLSPGAKLGPYEIVAPLGAGGMGVVYRARDTRLERTVAIKVLPPHLSSDPVLRQRFEREAKIVSSLNHPHICVVHDIGQQDGIDFLVMEYLEGETLATRLLKGPLPLDKVLRYATEIADALDKAHRSGVVHRDVKPGNIMLTASGTKLLDFGLAKTAAPVSSGITLTASAMRSAPLTQGGTIVGTFHYMSPEQVEGKEDLDGRSDIFSFGAVLYEMVTGRRAFQGKSLLSVASAVLEKDPEPIGTLQPMTPPALDRAVRRCLAKDPENRWQTARDLELELKWIAEPGAQAGVATPVVLPARRGHERLAWAAAVALFVLTTIALTVGFVQRAPKPPQQMRLSAEIGADASLYTAYGASAILSPDGTRMALVATGSDQKRRIYVRSLDQLQAIALSGTDNARDPFFSPDGQWIGFFADAKLKKISVQGGAAVTLCDARDDRGGSWGDDGTIVFTANVTAPLSKVSSAGGTPQPLTTLDKQANEITQRWPQVLPGGKAVLFTSSPNTNAGEDAEIVVYSTASGQRKTVQRGGFYGRYLPTGHIAYVHEGTLFAVPFGLKRLEATGQPAPILEGVVTPPVGGAAQFSFSDSGNLAYVAGRGAGGQGVSIYWMDREGKFTPLRETPGSYFNPAFSPDGKRLALDINDGKRNDIWVYEWERDTLTRLTFAGESNSSPVWTPDGQRIVYSSQEKGGARNLWWIRADGAGNAQRLTESKNAQIAPSWPPDGKVLTFQQQNPDTNWDIMTLPIEGDEKSGWKPGEPKAFVNSTFAEITAAFSPDGRWLAYASNESGQYEVYVRPFPGPGGKWQVSTGDGAAPKWSRDGKELFYRTTDAKITVVNYTASGDSFHADKPRLWSPGQFTDRGGNYNFDLHPDGKRFAVLKAPAGAEQAAAVNKVSFIFNFFDELRRKLPPRSP